MKLTGKVFALTRDCTAVQIPSGMSIVIPQGTEVLVTQHLGGNLTVTFPGGLARISEQDLDALGPEAAMAAKKPEQNSALSDAVADVTDKQIWDKLRNVYDPEIPVNLVDLGLVYSVDVERKSEGVCVSVKMTLTAPGCGMGPAIAEDARRQLMSLPGVIEADVQIVWDPPWNQSMMSEAGKMKLGLI